jgi:hypothetical protein
MCLKAAYNSSASLKGSPPSELVLLGAIGYTELDPRATCLCYLLSASAICVCERMYVSRRIERASTDNQPARNDMQATTYTIIIRSDLWPRIAHDF